ncbi:MAG: hypothetical protein VB082_10545 [Christensenella sp.]|nr:hypothetical protein [Christensenella sp.]
MTLFLQIALLAVAAALVVNMIVYAAKHDSVKSVDYRKEFTLRYPRLYLWISLVFFGAIIFFLLNMIIWQNFSWPGLVLLAVLAVCSLPALLLALRWKIRVKEEYIVYTGMFGGSKQVYYKDVSRVIVTPKSVTMVTTLKTFRFLSGVYYTEDFLFRLRDNGVQIERYL